MCLVFLLGRVAGAGHTLVVVLAIYIWWFCLLLFKFKKRRERAALPPEEHFRLRRRDAPGFYPFCFAKAEAWDAEAIDHLNRFFASPCFQEPASMTNIGLPSWAAPGVR